MFQRMTFRLAVLLVCFAPTMVLAQVDGDPATEEVPRVVPYDGVINLDGQPFDGLMDMRFSLYAAPDGGEAVWAERWAQVDERAVTVTGGRFAVNLGAFTPIEDTILDAGTLYLGIEVRRAGDGAFVALGGRQRINPVPYAMWSAASADLEVAGELEVGGHATVGGDARVTGELMFGVPGSWARAIRYNNENQRLVIADANSTISSVFLQRPLVLGTQADPGTLVVWQRATFNNPLTVSDSLTLGGGTTVNGPFTFSSRPTLDNGLSANGLFYFTGQLRIAGQLKFWDDAADGYLTMMEYDTDSGLLHLFDGVMSVGQNVRVNGGMTVTQNFRVNGDVTLADCRVCVNFRNNDGERRRGACVRLVAGSQSGFSDFDSDIGDNDEFGLSFLCDGRGNEAGDWNRTP